jgi:hypothetical protein
VQAPTVGRIVHYSWGGKRLAAIVTAAYEGGRVSLAAFSPGWGKLLEVESSSYAEEHYPIDPDPNKIEIPSGCWTWPPRA